MNLDMTLADVLSHLRQIELSEDDDQPQTIYVRRPWMPTSVALLAKAPPDGRTTPVDGCDYFLEASIAQDFFRAWPSSFEEGCGRIIQYAENDA
jgi:hypothetical protein